MDDALLGVLHIEVPYSVNTGAGAERPYEGCTAFDSFVVPIASRRHQVVRRAEGQFRVAHPSPGLLQAIESLRARDLVQQMAVYVDQGLTAWKVGDAMLIPEFLKESECCHADACYWMTAPD
jgi:hypothetical protein